MKVPQIHTVSMVQTETLSWKIVSSKGFVLQEGIIANTPQEVEQYIRRYISSFSGWSYEIVYKKPRCL